MGLAVIAFSIMSLAVKFLPAGFPVFELVFFRSLVAVVIAYTTLKINKIHPWGKRRDLLILRSLFGFGGLTLFFLTVQNMPLATASGKDRSLRARAAVSPRTKHRMIGDSRLSAASVSMFCIRPPFHFSRTGAGCRKYKSRPARKGF